MSVLQVGALLTSPLHEHPMNLSTEAAAAGDKTSSPIKHATFILYINAALWSSPSYVWISFHKCCHKNSNFLTSLSLICISDRSSRLIQSWVFLGKLWRFHLWIGVGTWAKDCSTDFGNIDLRSIWFHFWSGCSHLAMRTDPKPRGHHFQLLLEQLKTIQT